MKKNTDYRKKTCFILAGFLIIISFVLAYYPRSPESLPPPNISNFAVLEDATGLMSVEDVIGKTSDFVSQKRTVFYHKRSFSAFWITFTLDKTDTPDTDRILEIDNASLESIDIYFPGHDVVNMGRRVSIREIPLKTRNQNVSIPTDMPYGVPIYMRVETSTIMLVPVRMIHMADMVNRSLFETLAFGCFFGIVIAILFVNLFSYFMLKSNNFIIYVLYLTSLLLYHLRVHGFLYLLPIPFAIETAILWISLGGVGVCMILFAQKFLGLKKRMPAVNATLNVFTAIFILQTIMGTFVSSFWANQIAYITGFIIPLILISTTVKVYFSGYREAHYYLLAWASLFTGTLIWSTSAYAQAQIPANYFFVIGTSIDSLLFTLAIFDKIKTELGEKEKIVASVNHYKDLSRTDSLTGLYNRRYIDDMIKRLEAEDEISRQHAIIMIDIDNFKIINDTFGHPAGDLVLANTGAQIKKNIRRTDIAARYGGDEFLIFLPGANTAVASNIAENIRKEILKAPCSSDTGDKIEQTVSIGITENRTDDSFDASLLRADAALYKAKHAGRNCISVL